jgi:hypothetical protein
MALVALPIWLLVRGGLSLALQGSLSTATLKIDAISAGLHSNLNGDKGDYGTPWNINAGLTPSFGVDTMGRIAVTWQHQCKATQP